MKAFKIELYKQKKFLFVLCFIFPLLLNGLLYVDLQYRYEGYLLLHREEYGLSYWQLIFKEQSVFYFAELFHVVAAALVYEIFSVDLKNNGWMLVASSKYRKGSVLLGKYMVALWGALIYFAVDYISLFLIGKDIGVQGAFDGMLFLKTFFIQFTSASMIIAFYICVVCFIKRISLLIILGGAFMSVSIALYYDGTFQFLPYAPSTYISHAFRTNQNEFVISVLVAIVLSITFMYVSNFLLRRNRDLSL